MLACDGIWDVMQNADCGAFVRDQLQAGFSAEQIAERILTECLGLGSKVCV